MLRRCSSFCAQRQKYREGILRADRAVLCGAVLLALIQPLHSWSPGLADSLCAAGHGKRAVRCRADESRGRLLVGSRRLSFRMAETEQREVKSPRRKPEGGGGAAASELLRGRAELAPRVARIAQRRAAALQAGEGAGSGEVVVLAHGLEGTAEDLAYLKRVLLAKEAPRTPLLVLNAASNEDETRDGVAAGGRRLAEEVLGAVEGAGGAVGRLSLVGNSLGGLYARYALALLFNPEDGLVCGVEAGTLVTTASPHLGVRSFTYLPVPQPLHVLGGVLVGRTGDDLFLRTPEPDHHSLLARMGLDALFLAPLAAFNRRRAYANLSGDFLVPFGTAAFAVREGEATWGLLEQRTAASFLAAASPLPAPAPGISLYELLVPPAPPPADPAAFPSLEHAMAAGLDSVGWSKVAVAFPPALLPLTHNKICALEGGGVVRAGLRWLWEEGRGVMDELADFLLTPDPEHDAP